MGILLTFFKVFRMRNYYAFCLWDTCEKDTGIFFVVCGFQKCREGEVPRTCFTTHVTK